MIQKRNILLVFATMFLVARVNAQSNTPVRLALIAESGDASAASDLLTAEFSKNPHVTLLERNDIEKVYREQGLSAANRDYLKLGQLLGADGVLLVSAIANTNSFAVPLQLASMVPNKPDLRLQLIAVKPGVLLASDRFSSPDDLFQWASGVAAHLDSLLPKLSVLVQDAVPISVVNFRSAIQSPETRETERQLTALAIERLSHEHQLFVLERTKMQLLASEKELRGLGDSAFWNGSYLLDGTLDRDGYSPNKITISARLVPPKGGAPVSIEVSGSRTNFSAIINQLANKVRDSLKITAIAAPWNAADEAQKYFEEAQWALRWGLLEQAQSASDSAWALGKQDQDGALARLSAYARAIPDVDPTGIRHIDKKNRITYLSVTNRPDPAEVDQALLVLQIYEQFGRTLPLDAPQQDSPYYIAGLTALHKATDVLRHFYFHPESQAEVSEKLADLRAATRGVAAWMGRSPSVHKTYWVERHIPTHDEFYNDFNDDLGRYHRLNLLRNLYQTELQSGRFWQDNPEDCLTLYRSLMESPLFTAIHKDLWNMGEGNSQLAAWNTEERKRLPAVWEGFVAELDRSTNAFLQMEGKLAEFIGAEASRTHADDEMAKLKVQGQEAIKIMDPIYVERDKKMQAAWTNLFDFVFNHYDQIVAGREQLLFIGLGLDELNPHEGQVFPTVEALDNAYRTVCAPKLNALHDDYSSRFSEQLKEMRGLPTFNERKEYLTKFTPYDSAAFSRLFANQSYSKAQAAELKPLFEAYRSNLVAQATNHSAKFFANANARNIKSFYEDKLDEILNISAPQTGANTPAAPAPTSSMAAPQRLSPGSTEAPANALIAKMFLGFPTNQLPATNIESLVVFGHRMRDDKLLLDLRYRDNWGYVTNLPYRVAVYREAAAILQAHSGWTMMAFPHYGDATTGMGDFLQANFDVAATFGSPLYLEIFKNDLYVSDDDAIRRYDAKRKQWQELPFPGQERAQLFAVENHLYAASPEGIWEILDSGQSARILASVRRRPAASLLDERDSLGKPVLFSGKDHSLWAALDGEVFAWDGKDWKPVLKIEDAYRPEISRDTALFRTGKTSQSMELWRLSPGDTQAALCLRESRRVLPTMFNTQQTSVQRNGSTPEPLWKSSGNAALARSPLTIDGAAIYLITVPLETARTSTSESMRNGRRIEPTLVCLVPGSHEPLIIPIRLDTNSGPVTAPGGPTRGVPVWIECSSEYLFIGAPSLPGVWTLPKAAINAEIQRQLAALPPESPASQKKETTEERQKTLLAKYDLNHNGQFDPEEREAAINDPVFLESEIAKIDLNGNGQLDPEELGYFNANNNHTLDPAELAGIHAVQHLLAARALKEFDSDESGRLEQQEFRNFTRNKRPSQTALRTMQTLPASSEVERLEHYLESATEDSVRDNLMRTAPGSSSHGFDGRQTDPMILKQEIETYWANKKRGS